MRLPNCVQRVVSFISRSWPPGVTKGGTCDRVYQRLDGSASYYCSFLRKISSFHLV